MTTALHLDPEHFEGAHRSLELARVFANMQMDDGIDIGRIITAFVCIAGALVHKTEEDDPTHKRKVIEGLIILLRTCCDGPGCKLPASWENQ